MTIAEIPVDIYLQSVLGRLEQQYHLMALAFGPPVVVMQDSAAGYRYPEQSDSLVCLLKGIKLLSTLNAALVLLRNGYANEVAALCRMADDFWNEILYMTWNLDGDKLSKDQERFIADFFQEEFENIEDLLGSRQKRESVPRRKIFAAFGQRVSQQLNPSDAQSAAMATHQVLSGYIHGGYSQIMELYDGDGEPPRFRMTGMLGTPREDEWWQQLIGYTYRSITASVRVASKLGLLEIQGQILTLLGEFETALGCSPESDAKALLRRMKK